MNDRRSSALPETTRRAAAAALEGFRFESEDAADGWNLRVARTVLAAETHFAGDEAPDPRAIDEVARALSDLAAAISSDARVRYRDRPVSYVDAGRAGKVLRRIISRLAVDRGGDDGDAAALARDLSDARPDDRPLWLARGRLVREAGDLDDAIATAERLLAIQAVCPDAQRLLHDALIAKRDGGSEIGPHAIALDDLRDRFCPVPFTTFVTGYAGETFLCDCPAYVPFSVGNVLDAESAESIWNAPMAQEIRRSIIDGDFTYCSRSLCGAIRGGHLPRRSEIDDPVLRDVIEQRRTRLDAGPQAVQLSHDQSCNLACPSCRTKIITLKRPEQDRYASSRDRVVLPLLKRTRGLLMVSGGGDPFASRYYRSVLEAMAPEAYPGLELCILTNGLLLDAARWKSIERLHPMIRHLLVSIDAATAETYEVVRAPGRWNRLLPNLELFAEQRRARVIGGFGLCFVIQDSNFREMPAFVELGARLDADVVFFQRLVNFGSFSGDELRKHDVASPGHPRHAEYRAVLDDPRMAHPIVCMFELLRYIYADNRPATIPIRGAREPSAGAASGPSPPRRYQMPRIVPVGTR